MPENKNKIEELRKQILIAEESLEMAKRALLELSGDETQSFSNIDIDKARASENGDVIEGFFNGENMVGPEGKIYPVPANYASKSKLVEGDGLKLTIGDDGSFVFKQIAPVKRKSLQGTLKFADNAYHVLAEGHSYKILYASVTYHKGKPGDRVSIVLPEDGQAHWAVLESVLHDIDSNKGEIVEESRESNISEPTQLNGQEKLQSIPEQVAYQEPVVDSVMDLKGVEQPKAPDDITQAPQASTEETLSAEINKPQERKVTGEDLKTKLGIDDININPTSRTEAPREANPGQIPRPSVSNKTIINPAPASGPAPNQTISEMDI